MDLGLKNRTAIVAAASKGLGLAVAEELAKEGANVAICSRNGEELKKAAAKVKEAAGREPLWQAFDLRNYEEVQRFVKAVTQKFGTVDICVANAGGPPSKKFLDVSIEEWRTAVDTNLMTTVYLAREVLPLMQKGKWGRFITITSMSIKQPVNNLVLSNSVRAAVVGLARTLANEFGADGITVNNVGPGYTRTARLEELAAKQQQAKGISLEQVFEQMASEVPAKRIGTPREFAALVTFLASERASYINGTTIVVDGGWVKSLL